MLPDISRSKGNQAMKFGQLIEYKVKNVFLQKSCQKMRQRDYFCFLKKLYMR